jgi:hypothetical protein
MIMHKPVFLMHRSAWTMRRPACNPHNSACSLHKSGSRMHGLAFAMHRSPARMHGLTYPMHGPESAMRRPLAAGTGQFRVCRERLQTGLEWLISVPRCFRWNRRLGWIGWRHDA